MNPEFNKNEVRIKRLQKLLLDAEYAMLGEGHQGKQLYENLIENTKNELRQLHKRQVEIVKKAKNTN